MRIEVYYEDKYGRQQLVADSGAEKDSKEYEAMSSLLKGEYEGAQGVYYVKVSRDEEVSTSEEISYALQISMGDGFSNDYVAIEQSSEDTKNKTTSKMPSTTSASGTLSSVNALEIQATRYQATAQMLQIGYLNMANIYNRNSGR